MKAKTLDKIYHGISIAFLIGALCFSVFVFEKVFFRTLSVVKDLALSVAFFFMEKIAPGVITPSVTKISDSAIALFPISWEEIKAVAVAYWELLISKQNLYDYLIYVAELLDAASLVLLPAIIIFALVVLVCWLGYRKPDKPKTTKDKTDEKTETQKTDSLPFRCFAWIEDKIFFPIIRFVFVYLQGFLVRFKGYKVALVLIWLYNLNLFALPIDILSFVFYAFRSRDFASIYVILTYLIIDLSVSFDFVPLWLKIIFAYKIFDGIRRRMGDKLLLYYISKDKDFLVKHPGALFFVGKQRSKKTSIVTTLKQVEERRFREKALEKLAKRDKQFPHFPWATIEKTVDRCRKKGVFKVLEDMENFARMVKYTYKLPNGAGNRFKEMILRDVYGFDMRDLYEYSARYSMTYNSGTTFISIFTAIERYAQLYFIYGQPTPLDVANLSIREDFTFKDYHYFRIFDGKPLRTPEKSAKYTQYSHIIPLDAFRPGEVFDEETRYDDAVEYGIGVMQEFSKERKNRYSRRGGQNSKRKANQDNDLFELDTKLRTHVATIDNFDFWRWLFDDQRADALGADNKDMTTICNIKKTGDGKIVLPFIVFEELLYGIATKVRDVLHYFTKNRKRGRILLDHIVNLIYQPIFKHYDRIENKYTIYKSTVKTEDGHDHEVLEKGTSLYILQCWSYNDKFATDSCRVFYKRRHRKALRGLNDIEQYQGLYPTRENYVAQRSYFVDDMEGTDSSDFTAKTAWALSEYWKEVDAPHIA